MKRSFTFTIIIILSSLILGFIINADVPDIPGDPERPISKSYDLLENGKLVIVGGAMQDTSIFNEFIRLAGGPDSRFVIIPTAGADSISEDRLERSRNFMISRGLRNVSVLHTKDRELANSIEFYEPITTASGVWFTGGRQWRIADSYLGTKTQEAIEDLLRRGGVVGGSSAGATIQGSYLARGDTRTNTIMMGDHEEGFGFMPDVAIDQHLLRRNRQFDLIEIISANPELLGIGIDENTAIIVQDNVFRVIGNGYVAIYDKNLWDADVISNGGKFFLLSKGDIYNWQERQVVHWDGFNRGIEEITIQE